MEPEQMIKRLEWLDEERRKDKTTIASLEDRLSKLEGDLTPTQQQIREMGGDITRITAMLARLDAFDEKLTQIRVDFGRNIESVEKERGDREREVEKTRLAELEGFNKSIGELRKGLEGVGELKRNMQSRVDEEFRLGRLLSEVEQRIIEVQRYEEEYKRSQKLNDENRRQDAKRLTDMSAEVSALRKRMDEQRGKLDLASDSLRKVETRLNDFVQSDNERRQAQAAFIEKQNLVAVERERTWKDWLTRFEVVEKQAVTLDTQLQALEATHRAVKRSQESFDDVTQRIERRINEITEMQRLTEDRFRQEWTTFKADDQKRWTNYSLAQEEQQRELNRQYDKMEERVVSLEDAAQELRVLSQQIIDETGKQLQSLAVMAHDLAASYERVFGKNRS